MSTKFYIKDENGIFLSTDGKVRYTKLEGKELYKFLKSEDGKRRSFHVDIDDNGDKIGIEAEPEQVRNCSEQHERDKYRNRVKKKLSITILSANAVVSIPGEDDIELIQTLVDEEVDVEADALHRLDVETLRSALKTLTEEEYKLIYSLFLSDRPMSQREYAREIGMTQKGVSKRQERIFLKLKKFF